MTGEPAWARYFTPTALLRDLGLYCLGAGAQTGRTAPPRERVLHCYAGVVVTAGRGRLSWAGSGGDVSVEAPALFWLFPGVPHTYAPSRAGWAEQWVLFDGLAARTYEELGFLERRHPVQRPTDAGRVAADLADILAGARADTPRAEVDLAALTHRLVLDAARDRTDGPYTEQSDPLPARLRDRACEPRSVSGFAAELGVSVAELRTAVRAASGAGPKELVVSTRLSRAKQLLAHTDLPVQRVADEVGYGDPAYFTRLFTARVGSSPRDFRAALARRSDGSP